MLVAGEFAEIGTHKELMARKGMYYNLYKSQFGELDDAAAPQPTAAQLAPVPTSATGS